MTILLRLRRIDWSCTQLCSSSILGTLLWELCFALSIKVLQDFLSFSYWGFIAQLEVRDERHGFSKVDLQTVIWGKKEIMTFGNIIRSFYIIMDIAKKLEILVSSTILILYRSLLGLKNRVAWVWEWNLRSGESNDSRSVSIGPNESYMSFHESHNTTLVIKPFIIHFKNIKNPYSIYIHWSPFIITSIISFWSILLQFILLRVQWP